MTFGGLSLPLGWTHWKFICSKKVVKYFPHVAVESRIVNLNMNGFFSFPGNFFANLVYYFEVGDIDFGMFAAHSNGK